MAKKSFEEELEGLESLVEELDRGELGVEEAIKKYEQAVRSYRRCKRYLAQARKKIEMLLKDADGDVGTAPFEESSGETAAENP